MAILSAYPDYEIYEDGRIYSYKSNKFLKPFLTNTGYLMVHLYSGGKRNRIHVHRLVASAFIPNPKDYPIVNHKDEDKTNNRVSNLEWCTHRHNYLYGTAVERKVKHTDYKSDKFKKLAYAAGRKRWVKISQYTIDGHFVAEFSNIKEASKATGICATTIMRTSRGRGKTAGNYIWKRETKEENNERTRINLWK